jgi:Fur family transcriptional regulator, ferric uptake regulator
MKLSLKMEWALEQLRSAGVRVTPVRERVLAYLAQDVPATLQEISGSEGLAGFFDDATVYRTLVLLVEMEVARQFQFRDRAISFLINTPGECVGFLVCRSCGAVHRVPHSDEIRSLEEEMADRYGYRGITHELELYGVCPQCDAQNATGLKPTKLLSGMRRATSQSTCMADESTLDAGWKENNQS